MPKIVKLPFALQRDSTAFIDTPTATQILDALAICQRKGWMGSIIGAPGIGKTTTFRYYASTRTIEWRERRRVEIGATPEIPQAVRWQMQADAEYGPFTAGVLMATMRPDTRSPLRMMGEFIRELTAPNATLTHAYNMLRGKLRKGDLLIVDEAQHLQDDALDLLRTLHDQTQSGIIIAGNPRVIAKGGKAREADMAQFFSRLTVKLRFDETTDEDLMAFFDHHKVVGARSRAILRGLAGPANLGPLRRISNIIELCHELAGEGRPIELDHAEKAVQALADR